MKTVYKIAAALAAALLTLAACGPKEVLKTPMGQPGNMDYEADYGSITVTWTPVEGASQYFYKVENPMKYTVTKGTTTESYFKAGSLQPATKYTVYLKAIPSGEDAETVSASDFMTLECETAAPKQYDFAWHHSATIYWDWDNQVHKSSKATFGYDKTLNEYVIAAWGGVIGMDIVFSLSDKGEWLIDYAESTAYGGGPDANMAVALYHGIGGTQAANCWFYTNNTGSSFTGNEKGGHAEAWMYNPDGNWTGYYLDYGEYEPEPEPEPDPFEPTKNAEESWSASGTAYFAGEELGEATIYFDAESGEYYVESWYGEAGHDIVFTRDDTIVGDEAGIWNINGEKSSAYIEGPDDDGYYLLTHGKAGKGMASTLQLAQAGSGYDGTPGSGQIWATVVDPSGNQGTYQLIWKPADPFKWAADIYVAGEKIDGTATISYDPETGEYTIDAWHGVPGYSVVFTLSDTGEWLINYEKSTAYLSGPDTNNAVGLAHGITGDGVAGNCWFYVDNTGSWLEGDASAGVAGCWMYNYLGNWSEYRIEWKEGSWSAEGAVTFEIDGATVHELGTAILSFDIDTGVYTLSGWYGVPGNDVYFTVDGSGKLVIDYVNSPACTSKDGPDSNNAIGLTNGVEGAAAGTCWFYTTDGYSSFTGTPVSGRIGAWIWNHASEWGEYVFTW